MICIVSITRYNHPLTTLFEASKHALCRVCNYTCHLSRDRFSTKKTTWDKLLLLNQLTNCEYALWLDADVVVTRPFRLPLHYTTLFSQDFFGINSGVFFIKLNSQNRNMLNETVTHYYDMYKNRSCPEQLAIKAFYRRHAFDHVMVTEHMVSYYPNLFLPKMMKRIKKLRNFPPLRHAAGCPKTRPKCIKWLLRYNFSKNSTCDHLNTTDMYIRNSIKSDFRNMPR
jgi:hypothetical protein